MKYMSSPVHGVSPTPCTAVSVCRLLPWLLMSPALIEANLLRCYANCSQPYRCLLMQTGPLCLGGEQGDCWLLHAYRDLIFLLTFLITLVGITVLMEKARRIHRRVVTSGGFLGDRQWANLRMLDRRMLLYPAVFIFCWGPAVCVTALSWIRPAALQGALAAALYLLQALASGSQGALNSLAYGWTRSRFREAGPRRSELQDATTQTPLLRAHRPGYRTLGPGRGAPPGPPRGRSPSPHT
ncbi:transmembrane protein 116-like [Gadus macrocephalus]|uniref:transmembrane protein 116-like n=1 Tax=Gadus macrocephalus TaxID=80720 RepID=UPI0028CB2385|nr:transmembrane protein 116-like [Gadus macrocephalus]